MSQSLIDWAAEARTWGQESLRMAELMFPATAQAWDEEADVD